MYSSDVLWCLFSFMWSNIWVVSFLTVFHAIACELLGVSVLAQNLVPDYWIATLLDCDLNNECEDETSNADLPLPDTIHAMH
jgi:hypothetical protein